MRFLIAAVAAALVVPSVGCQSMGSLGGKSPSALPHHMIQSQSAPRPMIQRAAHIQTEGALAQVPETGLFQRCSCDCACDCGGGCSCGDCCGNGGCQPKRKWGGRCGCGCAGHDGCGCGGGACHGGNPLVNHAMNCVLDCCQSDAVYNFNPGPPVAQVAYPYYTVRGPRDFLLNNPPSIGPGGYSPNCPY